MIVLIGIMLTSVLGVAQSDFRAAADRTEVALDGVVRLTITMENLDTDGYSPPDFTGFEAYGPNQSRNMSWVNGKVNQTLSYTYTLKPTAVGDFVISPALLNVKGKVRKTNPVSIKVVAAGTSTGQNNHQHNNSNSSQEDQLQAQIRESLFVRVIPSKIRAYEGEQITLTYKLYYSLSLDDLSILKMPTFDGFLSYDIELSDNQQARKVESYKGRQFNTQPIHQVAIFANKSGTFTIDPIELTSIILIRSNDPGFLFPRTERRKHEFKGHGVTLNIVPLPMEGRPASFRGAVGQYDFETSYDKTETQVDDPITLKIKVAGNGNIKLLDLPDIQFPQSFEVYDPKVKESISRKSYSVNGNKQWEYLIIPRGGGSFQLPDISFSYFDTKTEEYVTQIQNGPLVEVQGSALNPQNYPGGGFNKEEVALLSSDIRFIKTGKYLPTAATVQFITRPLFHILTWLPILLTMFLPIVYHQRLRRSGDVALMKSKKAHKEANRRMKAARKLMTSDDDKSFYNEIVKSIWGYLADKFDLRNVDLSKENMRSVMDDHGITEELQHATQQLIDTCEMAIYAPVASQEGKGNLVEHATDIIKRIEKEINAA